MKVTPARESNANPESRSPPLLPAVDGDILDEPLQVVFAEEVAKNAAPPIHLKTAPRKARKRKTRPALSRKTVDRSTRDDKKIQRRRLK